MERVDKRREEGTEGQTEKGKDKRREDGKIDDIIPNGFIFINN